MLEAMGIAVFEPRGATTEAIDAPDAIDGAVEIKPVAAAPRKDADRAANLAAPQPTAAATPPLAVSAPPLAVLTPTPAVPTSTPAVLTPTPVAKAAPSADAVARMDWPELRVAVEQCTACGLCQSRSRTVFGVGHARAHWMIVGEAPGENEDRQGEPFVGAAGQLLDAMLGALQLTRQDGDPSRQVYICNTLKCRPPRNRNPEPEELAACEPFLMRQLELVQPRVILAMGKFAVQALLRTDEAIGRLRGRVHRYQGRPLIVTYHPAYLLRQPIDKAKAWDDLCLAAEVAQGDAPAT
jgi:uracil-DNA glycosylase